MSASKMRAAAEKGDMQSFKRGLPSGYGDAERLFKDVRKGMKLMLVIHMLAITDL